MGDQRFAPVDGLILAYVPKLYPTKCTPLIIFVHGEHLEQWLILQPIPIGKNLLFINELNHSSYLSHPLQK